jgi:hypothetical protein
VAAAEGGGVRATAFNATVKITPNPQRPWPRKWRDLLQSLDQIEAIYGQNDIDDEKIRRVVEGFFKESRELPDWIKSDIGNGDALKTMYADPDLKLADGMAQTTKHREREIPNRREPDPITARVETIRGSADGVRVEIGWTRLGSAGTEDALDLGNRCVVAWRGFFQQEGLDPGA